MDIKKIIHLFLPGARNFVSCPQQGHGASITSEQAL
jgi:hypothetical protein